jgi:hypothetical protein
MVKLNLKNVSFWTQRPYLVQAWDIDNIHVYCINYLLTILTKKENPIDYK